MSGCSGVAPLTDGVSQLSFIVPLGTKPEQCYNDITPRDMYSSLSCAWTGALLEAGSMAGVTWILLRSLRTHVRVCWDIRHTPLYFWLAQAFGWGLPALFLAISLPITGVSYRLGGNCLPNPHGAFVTWFGWLLAFACLAAVIQFITTGFCLFIYARNLLGYSTPGSSGIAASTGSSTPAVASTDSKAGDIGKRLAWRRVSKVMLMQWRSIVLSLLVILESVYFGTVYAAQVNSAKEAAKPEHTAQTEAWSLCLILNGGDKNQCLPLAQQLRLEESVVIASLFMASVRTQLCDNLYFILTEDSLTFL